MTGRKKPREHKTNIIKKERSTIMKKILTTIVTAFMFCALNCDSFAEKTVPKEPTKKPAMKAAAAPSTTLFDLAHSEIFSPVKQGPLNYSIFHDALKQSGEEVGVNKEPITSGRLKGVRTYIIAGPVQPLTREEIAALESFVRSGGNLLVLLHISFPLAELTNSFGVVVSNFTIGENSGLIDHRSQDFFVSRFGPHAVTSGLGKIAVYGTWGLMAKDNAKVVASTSPKAWADMNRDRALNQGEPVQEFGIVAVSEFGKGKVAVVADDAPFANRFINEADNRRLADNIIDWFKR